MLAQYPKTFQLAFSLYLLQAEGVAGDTFLFKIRTYLTGIWQEGKSTVTS